MPQRSEQCKHKIGPENRLWLAAEQTLGLQAEGAFGNSFHKSRLFFRRGQLDALWNEFPDQGQQFLGGVP